MKRTSQTIQLLFLIFIFFLPSPSYAGSFSSPNVPVDDPVYRQIDKLIAFGLVKDAIYGQRPWSRNEIARLIGEAMNNREKIGPPMAPDDREISVGLAMDDLLERLKETYKEELIDRGDIEGETKSIRIHPLLYVEAQYTFLDSEARPIIPNNGLGTVDASIEPLNAYDEGRRYPDGHQFSLETEHTLRATRYFSFYARPRFQVDITNSGDADAKPFVQQLYGKFEIKNVELEIGRDSVEWGQGAFGGILLSNNARPLDMIKLSNPSPTILPWIFKHLGPMRYTFFVANLGPEREFPDSFLTGLKLSFKPVSFFEMGLAQTVVWGGRGSPGPLSVGNVISEFFGVRPGDTNVVNLSNKEIGLDFRFWIPALRHMQVYLDVGFEDREFKDPRVMFIDLASYHAGIYLPLLDSEGTMDLRMEYRHGSPYFYRHGTFLTGMALNGRLWGDELGPQADGAYVTFTYSSTPKFLLSSTLQYERRDGDIVTEVKDASGKNRHVITVTPAPAEQRIIFAVEGHYRLRKSTLLTLGAGYERIDSFNFVSGDDRNGFLGRVGFRFELF